MDVVEGRRVTSVGAKETPSSHPPRDWKSDNHPLAEEYAEFATEAILELRTTPCPIPSHREKATRLLSVEKKASTQFPSSCCTALLESDEGWLADEFHLLPSTSGVSINSSSLLVGAPMFAIATTLCKGFWKSLEFVKAL